MAASSSVVSRSELEDGAGASRLCKAGPSSGKGSCLVTVVLAAVVVIGGVVAGGVVGGGGCGVDAVVVELNGVAEVVSCTFGGACWRPPAVVDEEAGMQRVDRA